MRGIILAAGKGARLNNISGDEAKCLVRVGGLTLLERQIRTLKMLGIDDIVTVVGYGADRVRHVCKTSTRYIDNEEYDRTNSLYSLWLARHLLFEGFVVLNADVLFHPAILRDLLASRHEDALLVCYSDEAEASLGEEEMKVKVRGGQVVEITKDMDPLDADGENVGIAKFGPQGASLLVERMDALITAGRWREWAPRAFHDFAAIRSLHAISTRGHAWIEIDFPADYFRAIEEVMPGIEATEESEDRPLILAAAGNKQWVF